MSRAGLGFSFLVLAILFSMFGCGLLPVLNMQRSIVIAPDERSVTLVARGNLPCPFTAEGMFPNWHQSAFVTFKSRVEFLNADRELFTFPEDFTSENLQSGEIHVSRDQKTATINLNYKLAHGSKEVVNATYDLSEAHGPAPMPTISE
jgi:hypothetical protein